MGGYDPELPYVDGSDPEEQLYLEALQVVREAEEEESLLNAQRRSPPG